MRFMQSCEQFGRRNRHVCKRRFRVKLHGGQRFENESRGHPSGRVNFCMVYVYVCLEIKDSGVRCRESRTILCVQNQWGIHTCYLIVTFSHTHTHTHTHCRPSHTRAIPNQAGYYFPRNVTIFPDFWAHIHLNVPIVPFDAFESWYVHLIQNGFIDESCAKSAS